LPKSEEYPVFSKLPIDLFATDMASALRSEIEGRYVLIGGDILDQDDYETPLYRGSGQMTKGLEVHAHLLAQLLDGRMPRNIPAWALWMAALGVVVAGGLTALLEMRTWKLVLVLIGQLIFFAALPFYLQATDVDTLGLPAAGWGVGWALAFASILTMERAVGAEQRRFAQSALGKYLPRDIAEQIVRDPDRLALRGEKKQIYAMFTDMEGFTKLSHAIEAEQLSNLLNAYLDVLSERCFGTGARSTSSSATRWSPSGAPPSPARTMPIAPSTPPSPCTRRRGVSPPCARRPAADRLYPRRPASRRCRGREFRR
jgi:adenylate cyclase